MDELERQPQTEAEDLPRADEREAYTAPRVRSSEAFEQAAAGCGIIASDVPCNGVS